jgi:hypothetical protein
VEKTPTEIETRLEIQIYQIADDGLFKHNRSDGTGWEWAWADWRRDWMDETPSRFAYRCLPLTIANQTGWWIKNPVGFTANWNGASDPGNIAFEFDTSSDLWSKWIDNQFGAGIITWNTPFLFRTRPNGSRLLVCGPANYFHPEAQPLTAIIETDWMTMSFTMNWKVAVSRKAVRFNMGDPLFQAIPLLSNICGDLETASVSYQKLNDDPDVSRAYHDWHNARQKFYVQKAAGDVRNDGWQKDYFQGRDMTGRVVAPEHMTKIKPPDVVYRGSAKAPTMESVPASSPEPRTARVRNPEPRRPEIEPAEAGVAVATMSAVAEMREEPVSRASAVESSPVASGNGVQAAPTVKIDDEWRRWIAENLLLDMTRDSVLSTMIASGVAPDEAARELDLALNSPYLRGSERLRNRLKKRDWQIAMYRKLHRLHPNAKEIERRHRLSRASFLSDYYSTNRPVIITGMMEDWPALRKWNLDYLEERFGDREIDVQYGRNAGDNYEIEREKFIKKLKFAEFIREVRSAGVTNDFYLTANNNPNSKKALPELWDDIVQLPEYLNGANRLNGFFWMGPAGTITPFHHDLTNNFMAQVYGRKRVKIAPSWDMPLMNNNFHVFCQVDGRQRPPTPDAALDEAQILECILSPGEILFLPIGCLHFVEGIDVTMTVSFTNFLFDNDFASFYTTYHGV